MSSKWTTSDSSSIIYPDFIIKIKKIRQQCAIVLATSTNKKMNKGYKDKIANVNHKA